VLGDERAGSAQGDDLAALEHPHPVAQPLGFLHEVRDQGHAGACVPDRPDQIPRGMPGGRVQASRHLVEKDQLGAVDQGQRDEQPLALATGQVGKMRIALVVQSPLRHEPVRVAGAGHERREPPQRLPHLDPLRERRFLQLASGAPAQFSRLGQRVQAEHPHPAAAGAAQALQALDGGRLPAPFRPRMPKISPRPTSKLTPSMTAIPPWRFVRPSATITGSATVPFTSALADRGNHDPRQKSASSLHQEAVHAAGEVRRTSFCRRAHRLFPAGVISPSTRGRPPGHDGRSATAESS
jgi:hypothetical protein